MLAAPTVLRGGVTSVLVCAKSVTVLQLDIDEAGLEPNKQMPYRRDASCKTRLLQVM